MHGEDTNGRSSVIGGGHAPGKPVPARRALIVGLARSRGSLAAARALASAGWVVGLGTPEGGGMVTASRSCHARHRVPRPRGDGADFITAIGRAVDEGGYEVVFGGADDWAAALSRYRDRVPGHVAHPDIAVFEAALDKLGLAERAAEVGLASPQTALADATAVAAWHGPVVVKCRAHWVAGQPDGPRVEARYFPDVRAAAGRIRSIREAGFDPILQQPVRGQLQALIGLFHAGGLQGRLMQRTSGLWPTPSGVSSRAMSMPVDESLARRCEELLSALGWSGLVEMQFLVPEDDEPQLIDLNGRFYGSMALANLAGPNLPDAWGRQVLRAPLPALPDARPGVRYLWIAGDLRRALTEKRGGRVADVWSTLLWKQGAATSVWDRRDPGPALDLLFSRSRQLLRSRHP